jgi:hypothetical protein
MVLSPAQKGSRVLYEYRHYEVMPGRLPDLHRRFTNLTTKLFAKHGIRVVGFWEAAVGRSNELHYILQWESMAEREKKWAEYQSDPEWIDGKAETERNGVLVANINNSFWTPTAYSPLQ